MPRELLSSNCYRTEHDPSPNVPNFPVSENGVGIDGAGAETSIGKSRKDEHTS